MDTADRDEAEKKAEKIMRPLMAAGRADALVMIQAKLANAQNEAVVARALPAFTAKGVTLMPLPAPQADIREQVRALAATLNRKTCWSKVKKELMEIAK